ncbi:MAG: Ricin lectin [Acidimicrobiaceae bacterium]|nr:Ricin lectin [Acidimicrobiaceae bacterium]
MVLGGLGMANAHARSARLQWRRLFASGILLAALAALPILSEAAPAQASTTLSAWMTTANGSSELTPQSAISLAPVTRGGVNVTVNDSLQYQTMTGFGAAFTDSSTYLMQQLKSYSSTSYQTLMNELFSPTSGTGMAFWRLPMSSSDFNSTSTPWTDDDTQGPSGNPTQYFGLTAQDTGHIIPVIQDALAINPNLKIVASPWSAPAWMKSNGSMICNTGGGNGTLLSQYDQAWADYFVKWIEAYQADGVPIWGITPQNEPLYCPTDYPGMSWTESASASWVHNYLVPDLSAAGLHPVILGYDHNWDQASFAQSLLSGSTASDYGAMAYHCYNNDSDPTVMTQVHNAYPSVPEYETECSSDTTPTNIIAYSTVQMALLSAQNWAKGAILWNVALNSSDGPHLGGCTSCVPLVTIDATTSGGVVTSASATLDNNYYQLGQISEFVLPGATHIGSTVNAHGIVTAAFKNPNGQEVLVATNTNSSSTTFETTWNDQGSFSYTLPAQATVTFTGTVASAPVLSSTPSSGTAYEIVSRTSGKPIGVSGASISNGGAVVGYTNDGDPDQEWMVKSAGSGYYNIVNVNSLMALDDTGGSISNGTQMQQYAISGTGDNNQQWQITSAGGGYYTITSRTSGLDLDLTNGALADGTAIQQWSASSGDANQQWEFVPVNTLTPVSGHIYKVVSAATGNPIDVTGSSMTAGAGIVEEADSAGLSQDWTLQSAGSGYYNLVDNNSQMALDDTGGSISNGTQMQQYTIAGTGNSNQQWQLTALSNGDYTLTNRTSGLDLDLTGGSSANGTAIQQWTPTLGDANQEWELVPVS